MDIIPKEKYQVNLIWGKLWALVMNSEERNKIKKEQF